MEVAINSEELLSQSRIPTDFIDVTASKTNVSHHGKHDVTSKDRWIHMLKK